MGYLKVSLLRKRVLEEHRSVRSCRTFIQIPAKITETCTLKDVMVSFKTLCQANDRRY